MCVLGKRTASAGERKTLRPCKNAKTKRELRGTTLLARLSGPLLRVTCANRRTAPDSLPGERFSLPASDNSPQSPGSKPKALSSGFGFGFSVPVTPSVTHDFSAAAEGLVNPVDKLVDERLKQINEDQLKVLQDIAANTKERGLTWQ